ncbi:hypothetical protein COCC4DRAFT_74124 [Bipolaris maydis ATCC 48331]|uniref:Uncharacterized protein n=2 Tax=Cochliobolus heterostrophus TaxID=5016 RepID=M2UW37_COCH5|nr:uncharacterized protein COCC4DRAFT_74124 [Bipolaris maydis ATCC 48331]EMD92058.1 hypothetical protein COCHEDRAFT_1203149 [Bipolaris maydis C5]ENI02457.1 hypothetical protein COCC4DRAFT_74124 [Bipolaris maydis ATCC 48331]
MPFVYQETVVASLLANRGSSFTRKVPLGALSLNTNPSFELGAAWSSWSAVSRIDVEGPVPQDVRIGSHPLWLSPFSLLSFLDVSSDAALLLALWLYDFASVQRARYDSTHFLDDASIACVAFSINARAQVLRILPVADYLRINEVAEFLFHTWLFHFACQYATNQAHVQCQSKVASLNTYLNASSPLHLILSSNGV